jgi:hypothetical protein
MKNDKKRLYVIKDKWQRMEKFERFHLNDVLIRSGNSISKRPEECLRGALF